MQQPKILVADDSRSVRAVLRRTLAGAGYDVILASDGLEAVRSAQRDHPDLVILDIQMPQMDGYTACQEILSLEESPVGLPIVFLTRDTAKHLNVLGTQLGAYLPKPVSDETLLSTVQQLLSEGPSASQANGKSSASEESVSSMTISGFKNCAETTSCEGADHAR